MNENVVLTGATGTLGSAVARHLAARGKNLALTSRSGVELEILAEDLRKNYGTKILTSAFQIEDEAGLELFIEKISHEGFQISAGIHTAAQLGKIGTILDTDTEAWFQTIDVNLRSSYVFIQRLSKQMKVCGGSLVLLSGGGATSPIEGLSAYACSKTAVVRLVEIAALELKKYGIYVNAVSPGIIDSKMTREMLDKGKGSMTSSEYEKVHGVVVSGSDSLVDASDLISYLVDADVPWLNGKLISARWDKWREFSSDDFSNSQNDLFTLRRIIGS